MHAFGCFVLAYLVGSIVGSIPAMGVYYALGGEPGEQAAAATWLIVAIVSGVATFRRLRRSAADGPEGNAVMDRGFPDTRDSVPTPP